jgi:hypothetical protein
VRLLRQEWLAAKRPRAADHCLFEGQVFKGVQRVVVDEDSNRALRRQQMGCMLDRPAQLCQVGPRAVASVTGPGRRHSGPGGDRRSKRDSGGTERRNSYQECSSSLTHLIPIRANEQEIEHLQVR